MSWRSLAVGPITTILPLKKLGGTLPEETSSNLTMGNVPALPA